MVILQKNKFYKKTKKLFNNPGLFFRDYLNKKYASFTNEQKILEADEIAIVRHELTRCHLESKLNGANEPVDVVFTWVNNADSNWQNRYNTANAQLGDNVGLYATDNARFESHNELYYSVYSVLNYLDWVNKIFIVTDNQIPDWLLGIKSEKLVIIDHKQIIDERYLPTFNSHVIEAHLHKIPNLSENFIYFNDDVFVARPLPKEHFFATNGNVSIFLAKKSFTKMRKKGVMTPTLFACFNCQELLKERYQVEVDMPLVHTYIPLKKSYYEQAWQLYEKKILAFLPNKFRSNNDLNLASFLVPYLMFLEGCAVTRAEVCYYFNIRTANATVQYNKLLAKKMQDEAPHSICANDFNSQKQIANYRENLEVFLKSYFDID